MDGVPVANDSEDKHQKSDQQQAGGFRSINPVPLMLVGGAALALAVNHGLYCTPHRNGRHCLLMRLRASPGWMLHYAQVFHGTKLTNRA